MKREKNKLAKAQLFSILYHHIITYYKNKMMAKRRKQNFTYTVFYFNYCYYHLGIGKKLKRKKQKTYPDQQLSKKKTVASAFNCPFV